MNNPLLWLWLPILLPLAAAILAVGLAARGWLITPVSRCSEVVSLAVLSSRAPPSQ